MVARICDVINQNEEWILQIVKRLLYLNCGENETEKRFYSFAGRDHQKDWMAAINFTAGANITSRKCIKRPTNTVQRYEYTNLYHTMTDWFNVFLMYLIFNLGPDSSNILWLDRHPKGGLDETWKTLFGHVIQVGDIKEPLLFKTMI